MQAVQWIFQPKKMALSDNVDKHTGETEGERERERERE